MTPPAETGVKVLDSRNRFAQSKESLDLAGGILADLELDRLPLANIVMKCARLARLTGDEEAAKWFRAEIGGYDLSAEPDLFWTGWDVGRGTFETRAKSDDEKKIWTESIAVLESIVETLREELKHLDVPQLTEGSTRNEYYFPGSTLKEIVETFLTRQRSVSNGIADQIRILAQIRASIYSWVLNRYHLLRFVDIPLDAFQRANSLVDERLGKISPEALQMFAAAQDRARSGSWEEWAQATASLRRIMKEVADRLYPATDRVIGGHALGEDQYVNRLWQFVRERSAGDRQAVISAEARYFGGRIGALYEMACKGVHDKITQDDVELLVIHLYLLLADLLSMLTAEELVALTAPEPAASPRR